METRINTSIYYGTVTGNAEACAETLGSHLKSHALPCRIANLAGTSASDLNSVPRAIFVVSTWGDGEPPDDVEDFWSDLKTLQPGSLHGLEFSVIALGDASYDRFCGFGTDLDRELERLGASRIREPLLCDIEWEEPTRIWVQSFVATPLCKDVVS